VSVYFWSTGFHLRWRYVMADDLTKGVRSTASIMGHPIHPMLVPFPIAFLVATLATDLVFWGTGDAFWARASEWLVGAGVAMGGLAAVFGLIDFLTIDRARVGHTGWVHFLGNLAAVVLSLLSLLLRIGDSAAAVLPGGLILSFVVVGILLVTGWMGGELAYRFKIGVIEDEAASDTRSATSVHSYAGDRPARKTPGE
jgi:uncharacterized membrane protein